MKKTFIRVAILFCIINLWLLIFHIIEVQAAFTPANCPYNIAFVKIVTGGYHTMAIDSTGLLWVWGNNSSSQLGNKSTDDSSVPVLTQSKDTKFIDISAGFNHSMAIDEHGKLYVWGKNQYGQLGTNDTLTVNAPKQIRADLNFVAVSAGYDHSMAIDDNGNIWAWGNNTLGQLGTGNTSQKKVPTQITMTNKIVKIETGNYMSAAIDEYGNLYMWGINEDGQLGTGDTLNKNVPTQIQSGTQFVDISIGGFHCMAIDVNGNLWIWGSNNSGQLGTGDGQDYTTPRQIQNGTTFKQVSAGNIHSMAIDTNGNLWTWGSNANGQLGDTTDVSSPIPKKIKEGNQFKEVSAGNVHSAAIDENQITYTWGTNSSGQLGDGTIKAKFAPIQITNLKPRYTVTFKNEGSIIKEVEIEEEQSAEVEAPNLQKSGYTLSWDQDLTRIMQSITTNAVWTPRNDTEYHVEHYQQNVSKTGYNLKDRDSKIGTTEDTVTAEAKTYTGFRENTGHSSRVYSGVVEGNGSLVLKLYYDRETYDIEYNLTGGTAKETLTDKYLYGENILLSTNIEKEGYTFIGWYADANYTIGPITNINETDYGNKTLYANWTEATNTKYTVEYYFRSTDIEVIRYEHDVNDDREYYGTTNSQVTAEIIEHPGFIINEEKSTMTGIVKADGSLVLKQYYDRRFFHIDYDKKGGEARNLIDQYMYGQEVFLSSRVTRGEDTFLGWYDNENYEGEEVKQIKATDTGDKKFYAKWTESNTYYISSTKYQVKNEGKIIGISPNTTISAFYRNINTNGSKKILNENDEEIQDENELIKTGYKLTTVYNEEPHEYLLAVRGDINGDGKITVTDLSMMNQRIVEKITLTTIQEAAADLDYNTNITVTDLSMLNQAIVGKISL